MLKIKRIRKLKPKIRKVRDVETELHGDSENFNSDVPVGDIEVNAPIEIPKVRAGEVIQISPDVEKREIERIRESRLYEARGRALTPIKRDDGEREYTPVQTIESDRMRTRQIGRDFGMQHSVSLLPENQAVQIENKMREEAEKKYEEGVHGEAKKRKRYPWEV